MPRKKITEENRPEKKKTKKREVMKKKSKENMETAVPADLPEENKIPVSQKSEQARYRNIGSYSAEILSQVSRSVTPVTGRP